MPYVDGDEVRRGFNSILVQLEYKAGTAFSCPDGEFQFHIGAIRILRWVISVLTLCVNIDVASNKEVNYGLFKSSEVECSEKGVTA